MTDPTAFAALMNPQLMQSPAMPMNQSPMAGATGVAPGGQTTGMGDRFKAMSPQQQQLVMALLGNTARGAGRML